MENSTSYQGLLTDSSGNPVAGAIVMVTSGTAPFNDMANISNESGEFHLSNLAPGTYTLQVRYNNTLKSFRVNLSPANKNIKLQL